MISKELIDKYNVINVWSSSQKANNNFGFKRAFIGERVDGQWIVVTTDDLWNVSEVIEVNTRATAMNRLRHNGYWTRVNKVKPC